MSMCPHYVHGARFGSKLGVDLKVCTWHIEDRCPLNTNYVIEYIVHGSKNGLL